MIKLIKRSCPPVSVLVFVLLLCYPAVSAGEIIKADTVWKGETVIEEDVLIPEGITVTVRSGAVISILPSESTKTDPEYMSPLTEITVRGRLVVEGDESSPVVFRLEETGERGKWAGIIVDGGTVIMDWCRIQDAETGINIVGGSLKIRHSSIQNNRYGLIAHGRHTAVQLTKTRITGNSYGMFELAGAAVEYSEVYIKDNIKKDMFFYGSTGLYKTLPDDSVNTGSFYMRDSGSCRGINSGLLEEYQKDDKTAARTLGDYVVQKDTVWRGKIVIDGLVRVALNARLIIMPGTIIEFRKKDTNGDGIGENGILLQGLLIAKGTSEEPIIFRSAEEAPGMGDWDAINIINSDGAQNLIEFSQIRDAYRGLHFHFSNVIVNKSVLSNNYRAVQFQESAVEMRGNNIFGNRSGIKARDSEILFYNNDITANLNGVNFFRSTLTATGNNITGNTEEGIRIREGTTDMRENLVDCNRFGLMIYESYFGKFSGNIITSNYEAGISIKDSDNIGLSGNFVQNSGFNGINIVSSGVSITNNHISENGERGIGIQSFAGIITGNSIAGNGLYALEVEGKSDISAIGNWWGGSDAEEVIFDKSDEPARGRVDFSGAQGDPFPYSWPLNEIKGDVIWRDVIHLDHSINVLAGAELRIMPGTMIVLSEGTGIGVFNSKILSEGLKDKRVTFTSMAKDPERPWDEVLLEHADGSAFVYTDFEFATWAVHSHFTRLEIENSGFRNNFGGIRFRSGPVEIRRSFFTGNKIGLRLFRGNGLIAENTIANNEIGVFIREKGGGVIFRNNNIHMNTDYNIRVGDFNEEDVDARKNWWGGGSPAETIYDGRREPGVGKVLFEPYLEKPVKYE